MSSLIPRTSSYLTHLSCQYISCLPSPVRAADELTYEKHIRPIFRQHCFDCHGAEEEKEAELDLRLVRLMATGGDSGPAIVPGQPDDSLLIQR